MPLPCSDWSVVDQHACGLYIHECASYDMSKATDGFAMETQGRKLQITRAMVQINRVAGSELKNVSYSLTLGEHID